VIFLPHSFHLIAEKANDKVFLEKFITKNTSLKNNMQEVYEVYQKRHIDFCISMRLHSMILSQVYEIPFISLQYSQKTEIFTK
jgi:polysaccharide pyruvyl transferase WcaK-like protein